MTENKRGFAKLDDDARRAVSRKGGRTAHEKGTAHEWNSTEATIAGKLGGSKSRKKKNYG